ncbi:RNA polymerase sigma factor (TIGR02999 family) [Tahibacter aquaticus]|uniref:RNA polymerase sigma factor (TIGR02999 family) n=1 Tax=Tahibacter aquaticus TaxID=520092 RepID=A0A4R6YYR4_9GAMM|nr:ECF-type sigma factor [Tahibacter aquaticus]TDR44018.1 RNA polymerase sigma factor (TIGR02999 family) [Tahibacter aquaticus]
MLLDLDRYDITELLQRWSDGDTAARNALFDAVYLPLRRTAQQAPRQGETFTVSALVHETFLRLSASEAANFRDRTHFAAVCVLAMKGVLVDQYRRRQTRGEALPLAAASGLGDTATQQFDLRNAIAELGELRPEQADALTLRYWGGLDLAQIAAELKCSISTVQRDLRKAEFFVRTRLHETQQPPS